MDVSMDGGHFISFNGGSFAEAVRLLRQPGRLPETASAKLPPSGQLIELVFS